MSCLLCCLLSKLKNSTPYLKFNICSNQISFRDMNLDSSFNNIMKYMNKNLARTTETILNI